MKLKPTTYIIILTLISLALYATIKPKLQPQNTDQIPTITDQKSPDTDQKAHEIPSLNRQVQLQNAQKNNKEILAYLTIPNTKIDSPIPQSANNEYYLNHTAFGEYDPWGCYFSDYINNLSSRKNLNPNTIIYGHSHYSEDPNQKEFTQLFNYLDIDFLKQNPYIYLNLNEEELIFQVAAVFFTDTDFDYINPQTSNNPDNYYEQIAQKTLYIFPHEQLKPTHKLLTLSTCAYRYDTDNNGNHRLVILAKLLPQNPTAKPLDISYNPNPLLPS